MRINATLGCALVVVAAALSGTALAGEPSAGTLSVERGNGLVVLDIRGALLGRLASGVVRVVDTTPRDRFQPIVVGRKVAQERIGPNQVVYRGQGLRFRMVGGGYRVVIRGEGISLSAVGRGSVVLVGDRRLPTDDAGVYSLDADCSEQSELCLPLPSEPERYLIRPRQNEADAPR